MRILGVDTSSSYLSVGVYNGAKVYEYRVELGRKLSGLITVSIKRVLDSLELEAKDMDCFACGLGPGSFTGLRIGLAAIKAFSWSLDKPMIGLSSLDILAHGASGCGRGFVLPVVDAKRGLVYSALYRLQAGGAKRVSSYLLVEPSALKAGVKRAFPHGFKGDVMVLGDASELYRKEISASFKRARFLDKEYWFPVGYSMIELALRRCGKKDFDDAFRVNPVYLYPKECQIRK